MALGGGRGGRLRAGLVVGLVVLALAALGVRAMGRPRVEVVRVERRPLVQKVVANGRVNVPVRVQLGAQAGGALANLLVDQGDSIRAGQLLGELAADEAKAGVARAAARLQQVRELDLPTAREDLRQAEVAAGQAARRLERARELATGDGVSAEELESARDEHELALSRREAAAARARSLAPGGADERLAAADLDAARARLGQARLVAPCDGLVLRRLAQPGDMLAAGAAVLDVAPAGPTWLVVQPEEKNLAFLRAGQQAEASADAFPDSVFGARITRVAPAVDATRGTIDVELVVDRPPGFLRPDMTVSIAVEVARREGALVLPAGAVRDAESSPWVLVARDGRAERREVTLGVRGEGMVEVATGLDEGDLVVPAGAARIRAGARLRAVAGDR